MTLADRVVVMNHGRIEQIGTSCSTTWKSNPNAGARDGGPLRLAVDLNNMHLLNDATGVVL